MNDENYLITPDGRKLVKVGKPVPIIDQKLYPAHEEHRRMSCPTTGEVYMIDRLYMETVAIYERAIKAEKKLEELEARKGDMI